MKNDLFAFVGSQGEMARLLRTHDWEKTSLGPPGQWIESLRLRIGTIMDSPFPMALWWGPERIHFYNDAYREFLGTQKHPGGFGRPAPEVWQDIMPVIGPMIDGVLQHGEAVRYEDLELLMERNGYLEQTFFSFSYSPVRGVDGRIEGLLITAVETTRRVMLERRQAFQLAMADRLRGVQPWEIMHASCTLIGEYLKVARVGYTEVDMAARTLFIREGYTDGSVPSVIGATFPTAMFGDALVDALASGATVRLQDVETDPLTAGRTEGFRRLGLRSMIIAPLLRDGKLVSLLSLGRAAPYHWSDEECLITEDAAERTRDAVERTMAENALNQQLASEHSRLHRLFDQAPGFIAVLRGPQHVFELVNAAYIRVIGERKFIGLPVREAVPEAAGQGFFELLDQVYASGELFRAREAPLMVHATPDGPPVQRYLDFVYQPVIESNGEISGIFVEGHDVTERKLAFDALREADRRKDEFLAMLAHELRNPLAPISAASELLDRARLDEGLVRRSSAVIARQVKHMTGLVDDLLDVSRVTRGLIVLDDAPQELKSIVSSAIEQARPMIEGRRHRLSVQLSPQAVIVKGDQKRLVQVLTNMLNNAAKYTPEGGRIEVRLETAGEFAQLDVIDNGIGIPAHLQRVVFDLFSQAERSLDRAQGGLGLGLALVKSLVELHGGSVYCVSDGAGQGSRFTVRLPLLAGGMPGRAAGNEQGSAPAPLPAVEPLRVMLVDDNADAAQMLGLTLESIGFSVMVETESRVALESAPLIHPDVFLLDIGMPVMDGIELARRLREIPKLADACYIAITGYGQRHDRQATADAGFDHHLIKPVDLERLMQILSELKPRRRPA